MFITQFKQAKKSARLLLALVTCSFISLAAITAQDADDLELVSCRHKEGKALADVIAQPATSLGRAALASFIISPTDDAHVISVRQDFIRRMISQQKGVSSSLRDVAALDVALSAFVLAGSESKIEQEAVKEFFFTSNFALTHDLVGSLNTNKSALTIKHLLSQAALFNPLIEYLLIHVGVDNLKGVLQKMGIRIKSPCSKCAKHRKKEEVISESKNTHDHDHAHHHDDNKHEKPHSEHKNQSGHSNHSDHSGHNHNKLMIESVIDNSVKAFHIAHLMLLPATFYEMYNQLDHKNKLVQAVHLQVILIAQALRKISSIALPLMQGLSKQELEVLGLQPLSTIFGDSDAARECQQNLIEAAFSQNASTLMMGTTLKAYKTIVDHKDLIKDAFTSFGALDAFASIATEVESGRLVFADQAEDVLEAVGFYNPLVEKDQAVLNSFSSVDAPHLALVTGPNGAGKSTIIKALTYNVVLAQSLGVAAAKSFKAPLYSDIIAYLTVSDDLTHNMSRFVAASMRADDVLERLDAAQKAGKRVWCYIDDALFEGTTPEKRALLSVDFIKSITGNTVAQTFVITHLAEVAQLAQDKARYNALHVPVIKSEQGTVVSSYELAQGISPETDPTILVIR